MLKISRMETILHEIKTPVYVCEEQLLEQNLTLLEEVAKRSGATVLLALKGFAFKALAPLVDRYLSGCTCSGLHEAKFAKEFFNGTIHTYSPAYKEEDIDEVIALSDHLIFNSFHQWEKYKAKALGKTSCGLRLNPEVSSSPVDLYNPCGLYSRLGITKENMQYDKLEGIEGLHFHALCEQDASALEAVLQGFEERFGDLIPQMKWVNFGGGHHITRDGYDVEKLIKIINDFRARYNGIKVYLEPGEAVGWQTGPLVASVLDIVHNGMDIAILDISAEAHMPDTLAMPYRAQIRGAREVGEQPYVYRLGGPTCLAGDIMGDYSFDAPLKIGDKLIFEDMIHYTIVKNTTFNGVKLPDLAVLHKDGSYEVTSHFGYEEYKRRN
ncbi:carboxynorspermidine decarboxylase [Sulfurospirillum diekertiae]|uniref:Carboxynorspermidine/carboxyspermidine decarboxylase n=2 Tax=Sulfurospirillum diekertiae TaxID=1854492 RepID=A0A290HGR3_9BACT|nr:carboxynorspermidine decarboxylase [Sulfurospirillum diekertiae]